MHLVVILGHDIWRGDLSEQVGPVDLAVGRIGEHDVDIQRSDHSRNGRLSHGADRVKPESVDVGFESVDRRTIALDKHAVRRSARERLDTDRSRTGIEIGHQRILDQTRRTESVEHRLTHTIGGRACITTFRSDETPSSESTGHDTHAVRLGPGSAILVPMAIAPEPEIVCIDCGGRAFLLTLPRPEGDPWEPGDIVAYRCADCLDRWDLVLPDADEPPSDVMTW